MKFDLSKLYDEINDFLFPRNIKCIVCDCEISKSNTYSMCKSCFENINFIKDGCLKCGKNIIRNHIDKYDIECCESCSGKRFLFDRSISCIEYDDISKSIVFRLKYYNKTYLSKIIAKVMYEKLTIEDIEYDYILHVPLHMKRYNERGFNQSQKISKYLSEMTNKQSLDCIKRISNTKKLYKLNRYERKEELKNAFKIIDVNDLKGKNVLLVDDNFTTGSTTNEISKKLKLEGVNKIYIITFLSTIK